MSVWTLVIVAVVFFFILFTFLNNESEEERNKKFQEYEELLQKAKEYENNLSSSKFILYLRDEIFKDSKMPDGITITDYYIACRYGDETKMINYQKLGYKGLQQEKVEKYKYSQECSIENHLGIFETQFEIYASEVAIVQALLLRGYEEYYRTGLKLDIENGPDFIVGFSHLKKTKELS